MKKVGKNDIGIKYLKEKEKRFCDIEDLQFLSFFNKIEFLVRS